MKNNYPLYVKWMDTVPWIMERTQRFPKNLRYSLAQKIDNICLEILELIVQAIYSQAKREILQRINLKLDVLRALLQMAFKMQRLSESQYEYISRELLEIGKMVGGCRWPDLCCASDGGITLTRVKLGHKRLALVLEPLNMDFKPLILDGDQTSDVFLIGTLAVHLQLC